MAKEARRQEKAANETKMEQKKLEHKVARMERDAKDAHDHVAELLRSRGAELLYDEARASGELCELARLGDVKSIDTLLAGGCSVNSADYDRRTCLHLAASTGNRHVVEALLNHGVDVNFQDRWGVCSSAIESALARRPKRHLRVYSHAADRAGPSRALAGHGIGRRSERGPRAHCHAASIQGRVAALR